MKIPVIAIVSVLFLFTIGCNRGYRSTTFSGTEFHAAQSDDCGKVYVDFKTYLKTRGFASSDSPSEWDSGVGLHGEGMKRSWFKEKAEVKDKMYLYVDLDPKHIRTSIKWGVHGTPREAKAAEKRALKFALEIDDWFSTRTEDSALPAELSEKKRQWFEAEIANIDAE